MTDPSTPLVPQALSPTWLQAAGWERFSGLVHGFSGKLQDREMAFSSFVPQGFPHYTVRQVHGDHIIRIEKGAAGTEQSEADGLMTTERGVALSVATADCVPLLMVEPKSGYIAALHAGWRGTLRGISGRAVELVSHDWGVDPKHLWVALGPAIGGCCYEVEREIGESMCERWEIGSQAAWQPRGEKGFLDLRIINYEQLAHAGVSPEQVQSVGPCTFCDASRFASYRREGPRAGRQFSVIGWRERVT